jgi:nicotinic acid mononucleotide adenylyltransferase
VKDIYVIRSLPPDLLHPRVCSALCHAVHLQTITLLRTPEPPGTARKHELAAHKRKKECISQHNCDLIHPRQMILCASSTAKQSVRLQQMQDCNHSQMHDQPLILQEMYVLPVFRGQADPS